MTPDDKVNLAILAVLFAWAAIVFPGAFTYDDDAALGRSMRNQAQEALLP